MARERVKFCNAIRKITYEFSVCLRCSARSRIATIIESNSGRWFIATVFRWCYTTESFCIASDAFTKRTAFNFLEYSGVDTFYHILSIHLKKIFFGIICWIILYIFCIFFSGEKNGKIVPLDDEKFVIQNFIIKWHISE